MRDNAVDLYDVISELYLTYKKEYVTKVEKKCTINISRWNYPR